MTMTTESCNCIVCAQEFDVEELQSISSINTSGFKICQACLDKSDPADDYRQARSIVNTYIQSTAAKSLFKEAQDILDSIKK
jgi:hypothetical protein